MKRTLPGKDLKLSFLIILVGYAIIPIFTPHFNTLDSNGSKFLALGILNLLSLIVFFSDPDFRRSNILKFGFFRNFVGFAYSVFILLSLLSFFNSINLNESVIYFARVLTVFGSAYVLFVILKSNINYLLPIALIFSILLILDSFYVIMQIIRYITGEIVYISEIKSVYSNKNVYAAAMFIKLPAAIWIIIFFKGWVKKIAYFSVFCALLAILIMSSRAFYLGLGGIFVALAIYSGIRFIITKERIHVFSVIRIAGLFALALVIYTGSQKYLYPKEKDNLLNRGIVTRLSTVKVSASPQNMRLDSWKRSLKMIADQPLLGTGIGNWKLKVLKYENQDIQDFKYMFKNHNDFIEVTAETGIIGGLAYLAIFVLIIFLFLKASFKKGDNIDKLKLLFLPAFGILAYSVDAFFNFPANRPEIQALFAFYVAAGAASSGSLFNKSKKFRINKIAATLSIIIMLSACYLLFLNTKSLQVQRLVKGDIIKDQYSQSAATLISRYPAIPNINSVGGPIVIDKARYLMNENQYQEAVDILLKDESSPYDARREYYLALNYIKLNIKDSAIANLKTVYNLKPLFAEGVILLSIMLFEDGQPEEAIKIADHFVEQVKTDSRAWSLAASQHRLSGDNDGALKILSSALTHLPKDSSLNSQHFELDRVIKITPILDIYTKANTHFNAKEYSKALPYLNEMIQTEPGLSELFSIRAYCLFYTGDYSSSIKDINIVFERGTPNNNLLDLRDECYRQLEKIENK